MNTPFLMIASAKHQGMSLYEFLDAQFPFFIKDSWSTSLVAQSLKIQNQAISGNPILNTGDTIAFSIKQYLEPPVNTQWKIYWQNKELIVVHKPANLPVQRTTRNIYNTLTALVRRDLNLPEAQPLHRLDLETAGFILFSKNKISTQYWQPKLKDILQKKVYQAIVWGKPAWQKMTFTCKLSTQDNSAIRCKMYCTPENNNNEFTSGQLNKKAGKLSTTHFKVLNTFAVNNTVFSLIECELLTGRKHQIRAQLTELGHPIVGDKIYAHEGAYYLKRLDDKIEAKDDDMLVSAHHLLVACHLELFMSVRNDLAPQNHLNLNDIKNEPTQLIKLTLNNEDYPSAWQNFIDAR